MKIRTASEETEHVRNLLAFLLVGAFITVLPVLIFKPISSANKEIIVYMIGQLSGMATLALGFYFVSKAGEDAKDAQRSANVSKLADAMKTVVEKAPDTNGNGAAQAADAVAGAATDKAEEIKGE